MYCFICYMVLRQQFTCYCIGYFLFPPASIIYSEVLGEKIRAISNILVHYDLHPPYSAWKSVSVTYRQPPYIPRVWYNKYIVPRNVLNKFHHTWRSVSLVRRRKCKRGRQMNILCTRQTDAHDYFLSVTSSPWDFQQVKLLSFWIRSWFSLTEQVSWHSPSSITL